MNAGIAVVVARAERPARGFRFSIAGADGDVARAYLYIMLD